jgi:hypothetical protein
MVIGAMDFVRLLLLSGGFGLLVCAHVALLFGLTLKRALIVLLLPPLAPYFGLTSGKRAWSITWLVALVLYGVGVIAARQT